MGRYPTLYQYQTIIDRQVSGKKFVIEELQNRYGVPYGWEHFIDGHYVPAEIFDRTLALCEKS